MDLGAYQGSYEMYAEVFTVEADYEDYISELSREELEDEALKLKSQLDIWGGDRHGS